MKNKLIRKIDSESRITIPFVLMEHINLEKEAEVAFVPIEEDMISLVPYEKAIDMPIIHKSKISPKNRIIIPKEFRQGQEEVEIFIYKGFITIK